MRLAPLGWRNSSEVCKLRYDNGDSAHLYFVSGSYRTEISVTPFFGLHIGSIERVVSELRGEPYKRDVEWTARGAVGYHMPNSTVHAWRLDLYDISQIPAAADEIARSFLQYTVPYVEKLRDANFFASQCARRHEIRGLMVLRPEAVVIGLCHGGLTEEARAEIEAEEMNKLIGKPRGVWDEGLADKLRAYVNRWEHIQIELA